MRLQPPTSELGPDTILIPGATNSDSVDTPVLRSVSTGNWSGAIASAAVTFSLFLAFAYLFIFGSNWGMVNWKIGGYRSLFVLTIICGVWWSSRVWETVRGTGVSSWRRSPLSGLELAWVAIFLASTLVNLDQWPRIGVGLWFVGMGTLLFVVVHDALSSGRIHLEQLADALLMATLGPLLWGILESLNSGTRAAGLTEHPNLYGGMAAWIAPIAMSRGMQMKRWSRWLYWAVTAVAIIALLVSGSRGALLGLIGAFAILIPRNYLLFLVIAICPVVIVGIAARWSSVLSRLPIYEAAVEGIGSRPWLGHGLFTFRFREGTVVQFHPHNVALQVAYDLGIVGLLLALIQGTRIARAVVSSNAPDRTGWIIALLATSFHQLVDVTWMSPGMFAMLPVLLACTTASTMAERRSAGGLVTMMFGAFTFVLLGSGWYWGYVNPAFFDMPSS